MIYLDHLPGRSFVHAGREFLYFGGTSYLGLNTDADFQALYINSIEKHGLNHGASRNSNIRLSIFGQAERSLAEWAGSPAAVTLSSGYLAGQLLRRHFASEGFTIFHHSSAHSALRIEGDRFFPNQEELSSEIMSFFALRKNGTAVLFLDSISFDQNNFPNFRWLKKLPLEKMILVVDDSHGIGVIGEEGSGVYQTLVDLIPKEILVTASLNKAPATQAGAIWGERERLEKLRQNPLYAGSSPPSPTALATLLAAREILSDRLQKLKRNTLFFVEQLEQPDYFDRCPGHPAFSFKDDRLNEILERNNIIITHFEYAGTVSSSLNRIVISAHHLKADIINLAKVVNTFLELENHG